MLTNIKKLFGREDRLKSAREILQSAASLASVQAMQTLGDYLQREDRRSARLQDGMLMLRAMDADLRRFLDEGMASILDGKVNHARLTLMLNTAVPYCTAVLNSYTEALKREMVETAKRSSNAPLVQACVANWLHWVGRDHVVRFVQNPKQDKLPWHEIRPATEFALSLGGSLSQRLIKAEGEAGRLQKQLAHLVLLSRTLTPDLQGRQLLIADRIANALSGFIQISDSHSSQTPYGQKNEDDSPPTMLRGHTAMAKVSEQDKGLYYGLEKSLHELEALDALIHAQGKVPGKMDPAGKLSVAEVTTVIRHLKHRWSGRERKRATERKPVSGSLSVCYDFGVIRRQIAMLAQGVTVKTVEQTIERAVVEDVSATGLGLKLIKHTGWLKMGMLIGVKTDRDLNWRLGVVRRAVSRAQDEMLAGIQLLCREPESVRLTLQAKSDQWEKVTEQAAWDNLLGLYLRPEPLNENRHLLITAKAELLPGKTYGLPATREGDIALRIINIEESTADCVIYRAERIKVALPIDTPAPDAGKLSL